MKSLLCRLGFHKPDEAENLLCKLFHEINSLREFFRRGFVVVKKQKGKHKWQRAEFSRSEKLHGINSQSEFFRNYRICKRCGKLIGIVSFRRKGNAE